MISAICTKDYNAMIFLVVPVIFGFGIICGTESFKEKEFPVQITTMCSKELGECRVLEHKNNKTFTFKDAITVNALLNNNDCTSFSQAVLIERYNAYGYTIETELIFK